LADVIAVCVHAVNLAGEVAGKRCLVIGDGAVGVAMALLLRQNQARVTLTGKHPENHALIKKLSGGYVLTASPDDLRGEYAHVFETVGRDQPDTLNMAVRLVRFQGQVTVLGVYPGDFWQPLAARELFIKEGTLVGSNSYVQREFFAALGILASAPEVFRGLVTHRFPLDHFEAGVEALRYKAGPTVKVMFEVGGGQ
jgi:L-idonate 5-dehydrogenase